MKIFVVLSAVLLGCLAQRSSYAGRQSIGYPNIVKATTTKVASTQLVDRFGEVITTTTMRLPLEAQGNADLVNNLNKLPADRQPFWLLNWKALEAHRTSPQTYPQRSNSFVDDFRV